MHSGWSPENENFASLGKFKAAKGGFCNLFLRQDFIQISSTGNLEDIIRKKEREEHIHWNRNPQNTQHRILKR